MLVSEPSMGDQNSTQEPFGIDIPQQGTHSFAELVGMAMQLALSLMHLLGSLLHSLVHFSTCLGNLGFQLGLEEGRLLGQALINALTNCSWPHDGFWMI